MTQPISHDLPSKSPKTPFRVQFLGTSEPSAAKIDWLWRGYLAPGQITLLTSLWKSGKTTLLDFLLARQKDGRNLLGLPVRPAKSSKKGLGHAL
jgi:hypothetical protein